MDKGIVISLCDYTGVATQPWRDAGYEAIHIDPQREDNGTILEMMTKIRDAIMTGQVAFVMGFPPCTDVAVSGAAHFASKIAKDKHFQAKAALVAEQCRMIGELAGCPWFFENPVSVFASIFGKPDFSFHPHQFGGYLPEDDIHPLWPEYINPRDAYTKNTCLWVGGGFHIPWVKCVGPDGVDLKDNGRSIEDNFYKTISVECRDEDGNKTGELEDKQVLNNPAYDIDGKPVWTYSKQHTKLGGKSLKTKNIRSATPRGFAQAVFEKYGN